MEMTEEDYLVHYGILRRSGRYPWGSGDTPVQRSETALSTIKDLRKQGLSDKEIAAGFSTEENEFTTKDLRQLTSIAKSQVKQAQISEAQALLDKGMSNVAIGQQMNLNESSVRALLAPGRLDKELQLQSIADMLERQVKEKKFLDVGTQVERSLPLDPASSIGVSKERFGTAIAMLEEKGYTVQPLRLPQLGTREMTTYKILVAPGVTQKDVWVNRGEIRQITEKSDDRGRPDSWTGLHPPESISSRRVGINWAEDGGTNSDGVIFVRPGAKGLDLGGKSYAQVRIAVDSTHYLKGMAVYKDDLPKGVDLVFNTNKSKSGSKLDAMKELKRTKEGNVDWENPFGAAIKAGGQRGHLNILREEGDWEKWTKSLPSQMLAKQQPKFVKDQLDMTLERRRMEFDEIRAITNPTVKRELLKSFSDAADSSGVHLEATFLPKQATKVLLPVPGMKPNEVFAPTFENGQRLALVRFPHAGTFEIPEVTVNNRNRSAQVLMGKHAEDAIGIHPKVAERLSGADFDGDHVIAIPNHRGTVKSTPALEGLKNFDPKHEYPPYDGMRTVDGGTYNAKTKRVDYPDRGSNNNMQHKMGSVSNLITDMTIKGASPEEMARAVRHSMVIIDSEKHALDFKRSETQNEIRALKTKYQNKAQGGASTLLSRAGGEVRIADRKERRASEGGPIDPTTGKKVYVPTGKTYKDKAGRSIVIQRVHERLAVTDDAHELISAPGTTVERIYADHSNKLKALGNEARKELIGTKSIPYKESAKKVYAKEVESLDAKLDIALRNAPRERQAQALANKVYHLKLQENPGMRDDEKKKIKNQALAEMRVRTGAKKDRIEIEPREWDAIQAGAITNNKLEQILRNGNLEAIKKLATPRPEILMTSTALARAQGMLSRGFTQAEVAAALGVSLTTLKTGISE